MRTAIALSFVLLVAGCATSGGFQKVELDMQQENPVERLPEPFETDPPSGDGDLLLSAVNGLGSEGVSFTAVLKSGDTSYAVWEDARIEKGYDPKAGDNETQIRGATRMYMVRVPVGEYDLVVTSGEKESHHTFSVPHDGVTNRSIYFTSAGILIFEISGDEPG